MKAPFRLLYGHVGDGLLRADQQRCLRHEADEETALCSGREAQSFSPGRDDGLWLPKDVAEERLECFRQGRVGNVALVLIELATRDTRPL